MLKLALGIVLLAAAPAAAEGRISVNVINASGLTRAEFDQVWVWAESTVARDTPDTLELSSYSESAPPAAVDYRTLFAAYQAAAVKSGCIKHGSTCYIMIPPCPEGYGGMAYDSCPFSPLFSIGSAGAWSTHTPPRDRLYASAVVMLHEIFHTYGAGHIAGPNVMDPAAVRFADDYRGELKILPETSAAAASCAAGAAAMDTARRHDECRTLRREGRRQEWQRCRRQHARRPQRGALKRW